MRLSFVEFNSISLIVKLAAIKEFVCLNPAAAVPRIIFNSGAVPAGVANIAARLFRPLPVLSVINFNYSNQGGNEVRLKNQGVGGPVGIFWKRIRTLNPYGLSG